MLRRTTPLISLAITVAILAMGANWVYLNFVKWGPVQLVQANGVVTSYGLGTNAAGVGTAMIDAQTAAASGDVIKVYADATTTSALGKDGVDWWFAPGVTVANATTDVWADGAAAMTFEVRGGGSFVAQAASTEAVHLTGASTVDIDFHTCDSQGSTSVAMLVANASATLRTNGHRIEGTDDAIRVTAGTARLHGFQAKSAISALDASAGTIHCYLDELLTTSVTATINQSGTGKIKCYGTKIIADPGTQTVAAATGNNVELIHCISDTDENDHFNAAVKVYNTVAEDGGGLGANVSYQSATAMLDQHKTVDGTGSGADADTIDGIEPTAIGDDLLANTNHGISMVVFAPATDHSTGDDTFTFLVPEQYDGWLLNEIVATQNTAGTVSGNLTIQIDNGGDLLNTALSIAAATSTGTSTDINASFDDLTAHAMIGVDIDAVHGTVGQGLMIHLRCAPP